MLIFQDEQWSRYLEYMICHNNGKAFRDVLQNETCIERLITMALSCSNAQLNLPASKFEIT